MTRSRLSPSTPFPMSTGDARLVQPARPLYAIEQRDAVQFLTALPSNNIDLLITDPPYESLEKHRAKGTTTRLKHSKASSNDWFDIFPNARFPELFEQVYRVLKKNSHFYMFCDSETMFVAKPLAEAAGFKFWKPIVWDKLKMGMGYHYRAQCEFILFFEKGKRKLNNLGVTDVFTDTIDVPEVIECARVRDGYPTEKPVKVSSVLVRQSSVEGEVVCDPFMGSASVGVAALQHKRNFLGGDTGANAWNLSEQRLSIHGKAVMRGSLLPCP